MLAADALTFAYPGQAARYGFSFTAMPGEITAISGPSGSGKSTLLDLIAGFLEPSAGQLLLDETDLLPLAPESRPVSMRLQSDNLFDHLTAGQNVELGLPTGVRRTERISRVAAAMAEVGLDGLATQPAATLSGGQKQRVALARTLLRAREVLLLDEPFSALDDDTRRATRDLVATLTRRHNWHTILVSHHADDVEALAARRYRIAAGELLEG